MLLRLSIGGTPRIPHKYGSGLIAPPPLPLFSPPETSPKQPKIWVNTEGTSDKNNESPGVPRFVCRKTTRGPMCSWGLLENRQTFLPGDMPGQITSSTPRRDDETVGLYVSCICTIPRRVCRRGPIAAGRTYPTKGRDLLSTPVLSSLPHITPREP